MKSAFFDDSPASSHGDCWLLDLTGGFGVDFVAMAKALSDFSSRTNDFRQNRFVYVEQNARLCDLARHNFPLLGLPDVEIVCDTAEKFLSSPNIQHPSPTIIFLDPARRDAHGQRTYALEDCTPNVLEIRDQLFKIADLPTASHGDRWFIVVKLSPMLDWHRAVEELKTVSEVHIVSVANECKELLLVVQKKAQKTRIFCVNDHQSFSYDDENNEKTVPCIAETAFLSEKNLLFIPNSSVMKAGCFAELCDRFSLASLAPNSHLFVKIDESSAEKNDDFPGKIFQISAISSMNKRDLRDKFKDIDRANIATRNFPMKPEELRRRLKLREGGDNFVFATTLADGKHVLILCKHAV